jgi:phytoene dehydrogenase-like protein
VVRPVSVDRRLQAVADVVVVGGGLAGCAVAARLAKLRHRVTLLEHRDRLGGAIGFVERDGFRWDAGPSATALPAVLRDLFRKSGRALDRELELVPVDPAREHRFTDGSTLALPTGTRAAQYDAIESALGPGLGRQWLDHTHSYARTWQLLRRDYLERPWSPEHAAPDTVDLLASRASLRRVVSRSLHDPRLREVALHPVVMDGHDPRNVPAWVGVTGYVEQKFGVWTVPGGMGALAGALTKRLAERGVEVRLGTSVEDVVVERDRAVAVRTTAGAVDAEAVVCAIDPRRLPALEPLVRRAMPALPPVVCHLGLRGDVPDLPPEVVLHGDPTLVVRTGGSAPAGGAAWTVLGRGRLSEDLPTALARRGIDVRGQVEVRVDRSPRTIVEEYGGSPYGLLWQGRRTVDRQAPTTTPLGNVYCAGAHASPGAGVPLVGLGAALVAQALGPA